jgi:hypothetical protein
LEFLVMSTPRHWVKAIGLAALVLGLNAAGGAVNAGALPNVKTSPDASSAVVPVRRGGGFGIYIGPSYGYGYRDYGYGYDDDYYYYPRRSYYYGYRPYRKYGRRWARERFEHPLGRR